MTNFSLSTQIKGEKIIQSFVRTLTSKPGVYRMVDENENVLYVGKAKNLRKRVANYTKIKGHPLRIARMISSTKDMVFVTTETELEALLLEQNLIKKFQPPYNVLLKDDKSFPQIAITKEKDFPQIIKYRGKKIDGVRYFGPYASSAAVDNAVNYIQKIFQIRNCRDSIFYGRTRACLLHFIQKCSAPCVGKISEADYEKSVEQAENFLQGKHSIIKDNLKGHMMQSSEELDYERAAFYRDKIELIAKIQSSQNINNLNLKDADVIGICKIGNDTCIQVFFIRSYENRGNHAFFPRTGNGADEIEIIEHFLAQFYGNKVPAKQILVSKSLRHKKLIQKFLSEKKKGLVEIKCPERGRSKDLIRTVEANAKEALERKLALAASQKSLFVEIERQLGLSEKIEKIEVYDNSHIQGKFPVGCLVSLDQNGYRKSEYRKFNLQDENINPGDDLGIMKHVLQRRFNKTPELSMEKGENLPDLIVIDGGKNQLNIAEEVLNQLDLKKIPVISIAKGIKRNSGNEEFYFKGRVISFPKNSSILFFFQRIRDEAHRFAIGTHRKKRSSSINKSELDNVFGIGPKKKKELLQHFGSVREIAKSSLKDLLMVKGISKSSAEIILNHFNS